VCTLFAQSATCTFSPKAVLLWRTGRHRPRALHYIEQALFGQTVANQYAAWRDDLLRAYSRTNATETSDTFEFPGEGEAIERHDSIASPIYGGHNQSTYDFGRSASAEDFGLLSEGVPILYEERSLDPSYDSAVYEQNAVLTIPDKPFRISPRGFVKLDAADYEWVDPRNRRRRICEGTIWRVLPDGRVQVDKYVRPMSRLDIVDILPASRVNTTT
jgi:hypothetical protein